MNSDNLPVTLLIPESSRLPIEVIVNHAALKMAIVERGGVQWLGEEWLSPGVYLLLDRHSADQTWGVYVGKAPAGLKSRLAAHLKGKDHWYRALLVRRDTTFGFNSAEVGWLEGRLYDMLMAADDARLQNGNRPKDETLPPYDRQMLEMVVLPVQRTLRMMGHGPETAGDEPVGDSERSRSNRYFGVTLKDLVDNGLVKVGAGLVSTNGAWPASAVVGQGGTVLYDGKEYPTPSAAAVAVKSAAANGWEFWALETENARVPLATLRARFIASRSENPPV